MSVSVKRKTFSKSKTKTFSKSKSSSKSRKYLNKSRKCGSKTRKMSGGGADGSYHVKPLHPNHIKRLAVAEEAKARKASHVKEEEKNKKLVSIQEERRKIHQIFNAIEARVSSHPPKKLPGRPVAMTPEAEVIRKKYELYLQKQYT